jgi:hypothetical protein
MQFKRRHCEFEQGCVLNESYTTTNALPPILPACGQPLLPACVFVTRDTVRHLRLFIFGKFVLELIRSWWEAFVNRGSTVHNRKNSLRYLNISSCFFTKHFSLTLFFFFGSCKCKHCPFIESDGSEALVRRAESSSGGPRGSCFTY